MKLRTKISLGLLPLIGLSFPITACLLNLSEHRADIVRFPRNFLPLWKNSLVARFPKAIYDRPPSLLLPEVNGKGEYNRKGMPVCALAFWPCACTGIVARSENEKGS